MKISDILKKRSRGISFEVFPPKTDEGRNAIVNLVADLSVFDPLYVSVSYGAGGTSREGTFMMLKLLREMTQLPLMSHLTGIGETRESMDWALRTLQAIGIDNILALRGDQPKNLPEFDPTAGSFPHAVDLVKYIREYGTFSIGVAVYPEGHRESRDSQFPGPGFARSPREVALLKGASGSCREGLHSPDIAKDMKYTKKKIDAGADFAITQMFFDNRYYYEFRERCAKLGITIPLLPGIMPILDCVKMKQFAGMCGSTIPREILDRLGEPVEPLRRPDKSGLRHNATSRRSPAGRDCGHGEEVRKTSARPRRERSVERSVEPLGVDFAIRQCEDLIKNGVPYIHFYSMNRTDTMREILSAIGSSLLKKTA